MLRFLLVLLFVSQVALGQNQPHFVADSAQVNLYFPHLVDGGPDIQKWQTSFAFTNSSRDGDAIVTLYLFADNGQPMALDLGMGESSEITFRIPARGTRMLRSRATSETVIGGWAYAESDMPVQATCFFRWIKNGESHVELSAFPTLPTPVYSSLGTPKLGIALANPEPNRSVRVEVSALDSEGINRGTATVGVGPREHTAFNLFMMLPDLPGDFSGSVLLQGEGADDWFIAWTLNADGDLMSTLPPGSLKYPVSQHDVAWLAFVRVWRAAETYAASTGDTALLTATSVPPMFRVLSEFQGEQLNAMANANEVIVTLGLCELIGDSESELGTVLAHEIGHVIQRRTNILGWREDNPEFDADIWGVMLALVAGYDPYAGAGALAKLAMATGTAGLVRQVFEDQRVDDAHRSFNTRLDVISGFIQQACNTSPGYCTMIKSMLHPHLPPLAPLEWQPDNRIKNR